jgi:LPS-assembly protein
MVRVNLKKTITYAFLTLFLTTPLSAVVKKVGDENKPVLFYADSQTYDRQLGILILKGHVEFDHLGNILEADIVTYNENTDVVTASGNVRLRQAEGDINFADYMELTGDMKEGVLLHMRTLMEDDSKIVATEGRKFENSQELDQAVYTPCELCGDVLPTWQINARKAVKDDVTKDIVFTDAEMRIMDVPVLYMPYATQPLERRSGFLIPRIVSSSDFGPGVVTPYYFALSESDDLTVSPYFFTRQNPNLGAEYRKVFGSGFLNVEGNIAPYKKSSKDKKAEKAGTYKIPETRGYVFGEGKINLSDIWRATASGGWVSDKTFFRKYKMSGWQNKPALTSEGKLEGFLNQRDYASARAFYFQGLQTADRQERIPVVYPVVDYSAYSGTDPLGGRFTFDGNFLNLARERGINMQRGIGQVGWKRPWITPLGQVFSVFGSLRGDLYNVTHEGRFNNTQLNRRVFTNRNSNFDRERKGGARFFPQSGVDFRWPFVTCYEKQSFVVQPLVQLIGAPSKDIGVEQRRIPNEDSTDFELNDVNLFSPDRFPGYDRIDLGSRTVYGGEVLMTGDLFGDVDVFLGQSYSFTNRESRDPTQGLFRRASDYVGRVELSPYRWLSLNYRFRLDQKTLEHRQAEVGGSIGPAIANLTGEYVFIDRSLRRVRQRGPNIAQALENRVDLNQITLTLSSNFTKHWTIKGTIRQNLNKKEPNGGKLQQGVGLYYRDDCFGLGLMVKRQYYRAQDVKPATIVVMTLFLKNVGDYSTSYNLANSPFGNDASQNSDTLSP